MNLFQKTLDTQVFFDIVLAMNNFGDIKDSTVSGYQLDKFQDLIARLYQCCQERMQYQCERFGLPDAEFRCLNLFGQERYLTAKSIAHRMNVVKSRVSKIIDGLIKKNLIQRTKDPEDSRFQLLSLTPEGQNKINEINDFMEQECASAAARYGIELDASLITGIDPPHEVESALAAINTAHNEVSSEISLAKAQADQTIVQSKRAGAMEGLQAQAEVEPLLAVADQLRQLDDA